MLALRSPCCSPCVACDEDALSESCALMCHWRLLHSAVWGLRLTLDTWLTPLWWQPDWRATFSCAILNLLLRLRYGCGWTEAFCGFVIE